MKRGVAAAIAACVAVLATGCGSSGKPTATTATSSTGATAASSPASATAAVDRTPRFAAPSPSAPVRSGLVQIAYRDIAIEPDTVRVKLGSTIRWTNYDSAPANVTSVGGAGGPYRFASRNFGKGGTFEITASRPGVIHYECTLYPATMNGTIEVVS